MIKYVILKYETTLFKQTISFSEQKENKLHTWLEINHSYQTVFVEERPLIFQNKISK